MTVPVLAELTDLTDADLPAAGWADWLLTGVGSALDGAALRAMSVVVDAFLMPRPEEAEALRASAGVFVQGPFWDNPRSFFSFVDARVAPILVTSRHRRAQVGGVVSSHRITTGYQPRVQGAETDASADALLVEHWTHEPGPPRATVVALHGFSMGYPQIDALALFATPIFRAGYDVALVTLPFHGRRTPPTARFSGERFAVPDVAKLNEAVRQAVYELHLLVDWLRDQSGAPVGLLGLSLGGYLSALLAGLRSDLDFVIPMVPPVCMGDLGWRFFSRSRHYRGAAQGAFSREELRAAFRVHSPLTHSCQVERKRLFILAGRGDRIVPPEHPHRLWQHWGKPHIEWFGGSHLAPFRRGTLRDMILHHLDACTKAVA